MADTKAVLKETENGLVLTDGKLELSADLSGMQRRVKPENLRRELIVKAVKIKSMDKMPVVLDATAGFAQDSLLLAAAGCEVMLYEYDPVIAALLRDALERAKSIPELSEAVGRMHLFEQDSIAAMESLSKAPDVIFLDPMFPERQKSALVKKKFQLLQQLEQPCANEEALLAAAIKAGPRRIVIKRPVKGPYLAGRKPDYSLSGKAIRYDCLNFARH